MTGLEIAIDEKSYPQEQGTARRLILQGLKLTIETGQFLCLLGPSGCGKTTLLNIVAGIDADFQGRIGQPDGAGGGAPRIGYVFQNPALLPWRTVLENLRLVMSEDQIARGLDLALLETMGLQEYRHAYPKSLSLGMSRRVSLARAFAVEPDILLLDEPFVSLDETTAVALRRLLVDTWRSKPTTVLFVTHDSREAIQLAQRIIVLSSGPARITSDIKVPLDEAQRGDPREIEALRRDLLGGDSLEVP